MAAAPKRPFDLAIAIPASLTSDVPHLREKTCRIGLIGRAAAIFRVNEIIIYPDMPSINQTPDIKLIRTVLSYMETPQYLRKRLFRIVPELQYAGTLPPLRTPHHPLVNKMRNLKINEFRDGVVLSRSGEDWLIDIGVERPVLARGAALKPNSRATVKITELGKHPNAVVVDPNEIPYYWGYKLSVSNTSLMQFLKREPYGIVIATSRKGKPVMSILDEFKEALRNSHSALLAFGAPTQGLYEMAARDHVKLDETAHFVLNVIPNQATGTVRTEEAVYATLSILNIFS